MHVSCFSYTWFIYNLNTTFISTIYILKAHALALLFCLYTKLTPSYLLGNPLLVLRCKCLSTLDPGWRDTEPPHPPLLPFPLQRSFNFILHALLRRHYNIGCAQSDTVAKAYYNDRQARDIQNNFSV